MTDQGVPEMGPSAKEVFEAWWVDNAYRCAYQRTTAELSYKRGRAAGYAAGRADQQNDVEQYIADKEPQLNWLASLLRRAYERDCVTLERFNYE